jgi:Low molecular weight phosphotyrosine protein phosphatase
MTSTGQDKDVPEVLFVCVQNAGRSQMAADLLDKLAEGRVHVRSAGSAPADQINPNVRTAMAEVGVDLEKEFPATKSRLACARFSRNSWPTDLYVRSERPSPLIWYPTYQTTCLAALKPRANGAKSRFIRRS